MAPREPQRGGAGQPHGAHGASKGEGGGAADQAPEGNPEGADECLLTSLPDTVVAGLWPAERVLEGLAVGSKGLSRALRCAPKVDLHGRGLGGEGAEAVAGLLEVMVGLKRLNLGGNAIGGRGATALAGALRATTGLEHLDLSCNLYLEGGRALEAIEALLEAIEALEEDLMRHQDIHLYYSLRGIIEQDCRQYLEQSKLGAEGIMALAPCLPPSLLYLDLSGSEMGAQGATALARALEAMTGLKHLALRLSVALWQDGGEGIKALAGALPGGLLHLDLGENSLGAEGARVLGPCLPQGLLHLTLSSNNLSIEGVMAVAPFLPPSLQHLEIAFNGMGAEGAEVLVRHLPRSLLRLDVCSNELGAAGAWAIAHNLPPLLEDLDLSYNNVGGGDGGDEGQEEEEEEEEEEEQGEIKRLRLYLKPRVRSFEIEEDSWEDVEDEDGSD